MHHPTEGKGLTAAAAAEEEESAKTENKSIILLTEVTDNKIQKLKTLNVISEYGLKQLLSI